MKPIVPTSRLPPLLEAPVLSRLAKPEKSTIRLQWLPLTALLNKIHLMAEAGSGKSRWLGRILLWLLFQSGIPAVVIDPTGALSDNFFDKIIRLPRAEQERLWSRVLYVDMSGRGSHTLPFPLYYSLSGYDSRYDIAQRYVEVVERLDPWLKTASVQGLNAIINLGTYAGMILAALELQITEAENLIRQPKDWAVRFEQALAAFPEVESAVEFFRQFAKLKLDDRVRRSESFLVKIQPFIADPKMKAMFGASQPGICWNEVIRQRKVVLLDFRHELNATRKRFKLLWVFRSLVDFLKSRGIAGRRQPVAVIIDEITQLLGFGEKEHSVMAEDLEELVSVIARNMGVYLCLAHQNMRQISSERIQNALMSMGIQMIGVQTDPNTCRYLADYFHRYDPFLVHRWEPIWMMDPMLRSPFIVDYRPKDYTPEEQTILNSHEFMDLKKFEFLVRVPKEEGSLQAPVRKISIARLDQGRYPNEELTAQACALLMRRDGIPVRDVLDEIAARLSHPSLVSASRVVSTQEEASFLEAPGEGLHWTYQPSLQ